MSDAEETTYEALKAEFEALEADHADADELPEEVDERLGEIETAMEVLQDRPIRFEDEDLALAGAFVSLDGSGRLRVERGYVRREDEPVVPSEDASDGADAASIENPDDADHDQKPPIEDDEEDVAKPLSDRLLTELTAHRTLALRDALARDPHIGLGMPA
ncbi:hypothetical protein [Gymnodinialimonas sp.]